jgi:hypothetical protein
MNKLSVVVLRVWSLQRQNWLARVRDESGHLHYVQVEPEFGELPLHSEVILFSKNDAVYLAKLLPEEHIPSSN